MYHIFAHTPIWRTANKMADGGSLEFPGVKELNIVIDVSGTALEYIDEALKELPKLAEKYDGKVFWVSGGFMTDGGKLSFTPLKLFKDADLKLSRKHLEADASGFGQYGNGTAHDVPYAELEKMQAQRDISKIGILVFTDGLQGDKVPKRKNFKVVVYKDAPKFAFSTDGKVLPKKK